MNQENEKSGTFETVKMVMMILVFLVGFVMVAQGVLIHEKQKTAQIP